MPAHDRLGVLGNLSRLVEALLGIIAASSAAPLAQAPSRAQDRQPGSSGDESSSTPGDGGSGDGPSEGKSPEGSPLIYVVRADLVYDGKRVAPPGIFFGRPALEYRFVGGLPEQSNWSSLVEGGVACEETLAGAIGVWVRAHLRASKVELFYR